MPTFRKLSPAVFSAPIRPNRMILFSWHAYNRALETFFCKKKHTLRLDLWETLLNLPKWTRFLPLVYLFLHPMWKLRHLHNRGRSLLLLLLLYLNLFWLFKIWIKASAILNKCKLKMVCKFIVIFPYLHSLASCSSCNNILNDLLSEVAYLFAIHIHTIWK